MGNQTEIDVAEDANGAFYVGNISYEGKSRVLLLTPVTPDGGADGPFRLKQQEYLSPSTIVDSGYCPGAPESIRSMDDADMAAPFVVEKVKWAEQQGYHVVVINCMLDPGLKGAKAAVKIPVIGIREATTAVARLLGSNPAYIYPQEIDILDLNNDPERTYSELLKLGRLKIANQGADVLIPNCAYLGGLAGRLQSELGVPVLANRDVALKVGELFATFRLQKESEWVDSTRSRKKMLISKVYRLPIIGESIYRFVNFSKKAIGR